MRCLFVDRVKKKVQISSPVQGCESLPYWSYTGVSRDNLIQNGFAIKQQSFIPNKRLPLPAWGEKEKCFSSRPEIGSRLLHYAGRTREPSLFIRNQTGGCCCSQNKLGGGEGRGGGRCQIFVLSGITCTKKKKLKSLLRRDRFHGIQP